MVTGQTCFPREPTLRVDFCLAQVTGDLDDCACDVETLDTFNNEQLFPKLQTLLESDYFRFYKVFQPAGSHTLVLLKPPVVAQD